MKIFKLSLLLLLVSLNVFAVNDCQSIALKATYYDSLFTAQQYPEIIKKCEANEINIFDKLNMDNLIAAYFFKGDTLKAQQLIRERILYYKDVSNVANNYFGSQSLSYLSFITIDTNKNFILSKILALQKAEGITHEENAKNILLFYIQDPYLRSLRNKTDGKYKSLLGKNIIKKDVVNNLYSLNDQIFQFYKSTNRLFSKEEVGSIYRDQTLFLMHDAQMREKGYFNNHDYYKKTCEKGNQ